MKHAESRAGAYHHGDLKAALRVEAERILATGGAEAVSLRQVARNAGVSHAAPYRHYASREALLADIAVGGFERLLARFGALDDETHDPARRFLAMAETYVDFALSEPAIYRLMFGATLKKADHLALAEAGAQTFAALERAVAGLGVRAPADVEAVAAWSMAHGLAELVLDQKIEAEILAGESADWRMIVDAAASIFVAGLKARLTAPANSSPREGAEEA
ncbi:TetR family transcriptional regulator [Methylocella tundrae]|uniref:TetR family transcriptional regulator n=1 Tax=Methylocella tundrae TaxID=227605 RepID=A0A8B6M6W1_METTU|nr:TetR/AcrR family transcriptional regulator [Methylocella tundrae]VTZ26761.1 TetR family transcriptional regulator [Methylocella tundrae]VTZ50488.1 TetR family transcriptional regulator [Methylocella tundrae]